MRRLLASFLVVFMLDDFNEARAKTLVFGIVPQQSANKLAETWTPLLSKLSEISENNIVFATAKDIPTFEQRLANRTYDIAYMNPYHYVVFSQMTGYQALAKQIDEKIQGIVVVHKDSQIESLTDLTASEIGFPAPTAFAASIIPQAEMTERGIQFYPNYVLSHDSVYLNVSRKFLVAGGGVLSTFVSVPIDVRDNLRILWKSKQFTPHAIATSSTVSEITRESILRALLAMNETEQYQRLLKAISFKGFERATDSDWDDVRNLEIKIPTRGHE